MNAIYVTPEFLIRAMSVAYLLSIDTNSELVYLRRFYQNGKKRIGNMTMLKQIDKKITQCCIAGIFLAAYLQILGLAQHYIIGIPHRLNLWDTVLLLACVFGIYKKSRIVATVLFILLAFSTSRFLLLALVGIFYDPSYFDSSNPALIYSITGCVSLIVHSICLYFAWQAMISIYRYRKIILK